MEKEKKIKILNTKYWCYKSVAKVLLVILQYTLQKKML